MDDMMEYLRDKISVQEHDIRVLGVEKAQKQREIEELRKDLQVKEKERDAWRRAFNRVGEIMGEVLSDIKVECLAHIEEFYEKYKKSFS